MILRWALLAGLVFALALKAQTTFWAGGYAVFAALILLMAPALFRSPGLVAAADNAAEASKEAVSGTARRTSSSPMLPRRVPRSMRRAFASLRSVTC